jgi:WD domain, G-beta repeat
VQIQLINVVSFSPDGRLLASASFDKSVKIWDGKTGKFIGTLRGHVGAVYQVCWSNDSRMILSGSRDTTLKLWDLKTRKLKVELPGHADEVGVWRRRCHLSFSYLFSACVHSHRECDSLCMCECTCVCVCVMSPPPGVLGGLEPEWKQRRLWFQRPHIESVGSAMCILLSQSPTCSSITCLHQHCSVAHRMYLLCFISRALSLPVPRPSHSWRQ